MEKYKTFAPRLVALLIDSFIMLPIAILDDWFRQAEFSPLFFYIWIPLSALVLPVYMIMMHGLYGQTLGKMAMNIKVLNVTEEPLKFNQAIWREIPQLIFNIGAIILGIVFLAQDPEAENVKMSYGIFGAFAMVWGLADIMTFFFSDKKRALHDFIAGTVVVKMNL
ncbi:MAG: RDD family protein [Actinomycetota bacterium]